MDELTDFADLRPSDAALSERVLEDVRNELFGTSVPLPPTARRAPLDSDLDRPLRSRGPTLAIAASIVAAMGLGGLWLVFDNDRSGDPPPLDAPSTSPPAAEVAPTTSPVFGLPRFTIIEAGWSMTHASESRFGTGREVVFLSEDGFDGPWVDITISDMQTGAAPMRNIGEITAGVSEFADGVLVDWVAPGGRMVTAHGWQTDAETVAALLASTSVDGGEVTVATVPPGASIADQDQVAAVATHGSYGLAHDDGRTLEISLNGAGAQGLYSRTGGEDRVSVNADGEEWLVVDYGVADDSDAQRFRANVLRDLWTWEFDGEPFGSVEAFIDTVTAFEIVDEPTWQAALPDDFVGGIEQPEAIEEVLVDVPLPDGFDRAALNDGSTNGRYHFIARVSGAVACAWLERWIIGHETGDAALRSEAAAALATAEDWAMLNEIADQGGWSDALRGIATGVDGEPAVTTGSGLGPPTRDVVNGSLGCSL